MASSSSVPSPSEHDSKNVRKSTLNGENKKKSPSFSKHSPKFVTLFVSKSLNEKKFVVHKEVICYRSPFFRAAFNRRFIEGQTQEMRMGDVDEDTLGQLVHWMYTMELERTNLEDLVVLGKLWILAKRVLMPLLQNHAMDTIYRLLRKNVTDGDQNIKDMLALTYDNKQGEHTMLRYLLVDHFASICSDSMNMWAEFLPQKLSAEVMKILVKEREVGYHRLIGRSTPKKPSDYHVEVPGE